LKKAADHRNSSEKQADQPAAESRNRQMTAKEAGEVDERSSPRTPVIYEIVRRLGEEEMSRPMTSLWWSGVAAGLSISFSFLAQAILRAHLPDSSWALLIISLGYSVGFLMVVLSRQQLFTESTVTAVLPVMADMTFALADLSFGHLDTLPDFLRAGTLDVFYLRPQPILLQLITSDISLRRLARAMTTTRCRAGPSGRTSRSGCST